MGIASLFFILPILFGKRQMQRRILKQFLLLNIYLPRLTEYKDLIKGCKNMTSKERIEAVIQGKMPDRDPVSLYKINPFEKHSFWAQYKSFENLLSAAREYQDTFHLWRPSTGFFFSAPGSIDIVVDEVEDTPLSKTLKLSVQTKRGSLQRITRTFKTSTHHWIQKPWVESEKDILRFLELPYATFNPDISEFFRICNALGDNGVCVIALPNPLAVVYELFARAICRTLSFLPLYSYTDCLMR